VVLTDVVKNMTDLLGRTLGSRIEIETSSAPDLWTAMADPNQVETALLNLAINARDAMPAGGRLIIACQNVTLDNTGAAKHADPVAGDYVVMIVSDTGMGMSGEILARAFEPFFTTKQIGTGSGLGLAMTHGFAHQSGGHVSLQSREGAGTTVKMFLPRTTQAPRTVETRPVDAVPRGRGEPVLIIEDDNDVRELVTRSLEGLDYRVTSAPDPAAARAILATGAKFDVILCGVVLPGGKSGPQFIEEIRAQNSEMKIVFMSGYPAEAADRDSILAQDNGFVQKPFKRHQLARAIRDSLDRRSNASIR